MRLVDCALVWESGYYGGYDVRSSGSVWRLTVFVLMVLLGAELNLGGRFAVSGFGRGPRTSL